MKHLKKFLIVVLIMPLIFSVSLDYVFEQHVYIPVKIEKEEKKNSQRKKTNLISLIAKGELIHSIHSKYQEVIAKGFKAFFRWSNSHTITAGM